MATTPNNKPSSWCSSYVREFNLPAYTYEKTFDYTKPEQGRGLTPEGRPKMMHYQQATVRKEVAVLVGDYQTVDDDNAQKVLTTLKKLDSACTAQSTCQQLRNPKPAANNTNPMRHALVVTNPLLPREYFATKRSR